MKVRIITLPRAKEEPTVSYSSPRKSRRGEQKKSQLYLIPLLEKVEEVVYVQPATNIR